MIIGGGGLTFSGAESSGGRDHGEGGAAVDGAQVVLDVGADVGVSRAEGRVPSGRQADQRDVGDDRPPPGQGRRPAEEEEETW